LLALDEALKALAEIDPSRGALSNPVFWWANNRRDAEVMKLSPATIKREWAMAGEAWLHQEPTDVAEVKSDSKKNLSN